MGFIWLFLGLLALAATLWLLMAYPKRESAGPQDLERKKLENEIRRTSLQIVGGAILVFGLVGTYSTVGVNQRGQHADRFLRAVQLLGHESEEVRVGAIGSLQRLAEESPNDRVAVRNILAALVRSPRHRPQLSVTFEDDSPVVPPAAEVEAALGVLSSAMFFQLSDTSLNLSGAYLRGARLSGTRFPQAVLVEANLDYAELAKADFSGADLRGSQFMSAGLVETRFVGARLGGANLVYARFDCGDFTDAELAGARFGRENSAGGIRLVHTDLSRQNFWEFNFPQANLTAAILAHTGFDETDLGAAILAKALFYETSLFRTNLRGAGLRGAHLWNVKLELADLEGARLEGASLYTRDIRKALEADSDPRIRELASMVEPGVASVADHLTQDQLDVACIDETTVLPPGFRRPPQCTPLPVPSPLCPPASR